MSNINKKVQEVHDGDIEKKNGCKQVLKPSRLLSRRENKNDRKY